MLHRTHNVSAPRWQCFHVTLMWTPSPSNNCFYRGRKQAASPWYWWVRRERELPCTQLLLWFPRETAVEAAEEKDWVGRQWFGTQGVRSPASKNKVKSPSGGHSVSTSGIPMCIHGHAEHTHVCTHIIVKYCLFWLIPEETLNTSNLRFSFKVTMGPWFRNITYDLDAAEGLTRAPLGAKIWVVRERHQLGMIGTHLTTGMLPCRPRV